jgi:hypothetical protein
MGSDRRRFTPEELEQMSRPTMDRAKDLSGKSRRRQP